MIRKKICIIISILLIAVYITGCEGEIVQSQVSFESDDSGLNEYEPEYGGQLILPVTNINSLNPLLVSNRSYYYFSKLIFESLFEYGENYNIVNQLAESYSFKSNNTVSIKLKDNVYWHDGEKFTADDVAFTINTIKYADENTPYKRLWKTYVGNFYGNDLDKIMNAVVIDELNIDIVFAFPFSHKLDVLTFPIIPKHRFVDGVENATSYEKALAVDNYVPIGTGPYKFVNYEKYKRIELESNQSYTGGRPYIDKIIGMILEDEELALVSFETGQIDLAYSVGVDWEKFDQNSKIKIIEYVSQEYEFLGFNFSKDIFNRYGQGLRKAMAYGINRQAIIENVYLGHATQTDLPIHPNSWILSEDSNIYGYNVDKAKKELENMGWRDIDSDGYYEDAEGNDVTLTLLTNSYNELRLKTAELIVEDLRKIGIQVEKGYTEKMPDNMTEELMDTQWTELNDVLRNGDYDMVLLGWNLTPIPELSFAFHSSQVGKDNFIRYSNEKMDKALLDAYIASNLEKEFEAYKDIQSLILEDLPYISLLFRNEAVLMDSKIKGNINPTFYDLYRNIEQWYIPKDLQKERVDNN